MGWLAGAVRQVGSGAKFVFPTLVLRYWHTWHCAAGF